MKGNEFADKLAKSSLQKDITVPVLLGKGEGKAVIKRKGVEIWQKRWEEDQKGRRYFKIQKSVITKTYKERNRREEIIITRLRLDHTGLNGTLALMGKRNSDKCGDCGVKENVEHILIHCKKYEAERKRSERRDGIGISWDTGNRG